MAISNLYPAEGPTLNLNFTNSRTLDRRITFERTTTGTYMGRDGLIKTAAADEPRFDHRYQNGQVESLGLLIEETSTNKFTQSIISNWGNPANGTKTANAGLSPDNTSTATLIEATSLNGQTRIENGGETTPGRTYTLSCFCKAGTTDYCTFGLYELTDGAKNFQAIFYLTGEGTVTSESNCTATISAYTNGWYRCTMTITLTAGASYSGSGWKLGVCNSPTAYYNADIGDNVYFWGAQLESKAFATSYMPSPLDGQQGSRGADNAYMTDDNFSDWYNQSEGTFYANSTTNVSPNLFSGSIQPAILYATDGTSNNRIGMFYGPVNSIYTRIVSNGVQYGPSESIIGSINTTKSIISYKTGTNGGGASINGSVVKLSTPNLLPAVNKLVIGIQATSNFGVLNGTMSQLTYYPTRLTNAQLQNLTK